MRLHGMILPALVCLVVTVCLPAVSSAARWDVPSMAPTIQAGIDSAAVGQDTVVVECGTYYEYDIVMRSGVYLTSATGEFDCVTIDAQQNGRVFYGSGLGESTVIRGFTIKGGQTTDKGGGIYLTGSSPKILNCHITQNRLTEWNESGVGMCLWENCDPEITDCVFSMNLATDPSNSAGGALYGYYYSDPIITNCTFYENLASSGNQVCLNASCYPEFYNCILTEGLDGLFGGAVVCGGGSVPTLTCCDVYGNEGGDWVGCLAGMDILNNNLSADPGFCDPGLGNFYLRTDSPCIFGPCGRIGTFGVGCLGALPLISEAHDVGNDQGRWLRLIWQRSLYDAPGDTVDITGYEIYRRQDANLLDSRGESVQMLGSLGPGTEPLLAGWDYVTTVPAHGESLYQHVVPTLCDSTMYETCWSVFFIRATTPDPFEYYDSPADSGYSIDNLSPAPPPGLAMAYPTQLVWEEAVDEDVQMYRVYGSAQPEFDEDASYIQRTYGLGMDVTGAVFDYYHVTSVDFSGNEGNASSVSNTYAGVTPEDRPAVNALMQNRPNPFEAETSVRFDLARPGKVKLSVYDVSGELVRTLTDEAWPAGRHTLNWAGDDEHGHDAGPGIYFLRMEAVEFKATRKVIILR